MVTSSQHVYDQIGSPVLLFRNLDHYNEICPEIENTTASRKRFRDDREKRARVQTRWCCPQLDETARALRGIGRTTTSGLSMPTHQMRLLLHSNKYDNPYLPSRATLKQKNYRIAVEERDQAVQNFCSMRHTVAYMAPFRQMDLDFVSYEKKSTRGGAIRRVKKYPIAADDCDHPSKYGNCLLCLPCLDCGGEKCRNVYLLHPKGSVMNQLRLSQLEVGMPDETGASNQETVDQSEIILPMGDTVRQLERCSNDTVVARMDSYCIWFRLEHSTTEAKEGNSSLSGACKVVTALVELYRLDLRTLMEGVPSFCPLRITANERFGGATTRPFMALLCTKKCGGRELERNYIYDAQLGLHSPTVQHHRISNIQIIEEIQFSSHPMVLWSVARSHVRPAMSTNTFDKVPCIGHGCSFYSLDLRTNQGTFQWSPSHENFAVEGSHSLSGLFADPLKDNSVFVSSFSAGKTWEIDVRAPCKAICTWSLPYDEVGSVLPPTGHYGAGSIFNRPIESSRVGSNAAPLLCVSKTPETSMLHLYQRPEHGPKFQTQNLECKPSAELSSLNGACVAASSVFSLPDVGVSIFTCGVASFWVPSATIYSNELELDFEQKSAALCVATVTRNGDVYAHSLLETRKIDGSQGLAGAAEMSSLSNHKRIHGTHSPISLNVVTTHDAPIPSSALFSPCMESASKQRKLGDANTEATVDGGQNRVDEVPTNHTEDNILQNFATSPLPRNEPSQGSGQPRSDVPLSLVEHEGEEWDNESNGGRDVVDV